MNSPKKISHIGIAVKDLDDSLKWYQNILGLSLEGVEEVQSEQVRVAFFRIGESRIELLEPLSEDSPIFKYISKRGEGIHHIAFEVEKIEERIKNLTLKGVRFIQDQPKKGAHNSLISFLHPKSTGGVLMELCEPKEKEDNP